MVFQKSLELWFGIVQHVHKASISEFVNGSVGWNKHSKWTRTSEGQKSATVINQRQESIEPVILPENVTDGLCGELHVVV